jgi:hypothetical protein
VDRKSSDPAGVSPLALDRQSVEGDAAEVLPSPAADRPIAMPGPNGGKTSRQALPQQQLALLRLQQVLGNAYVQRVASRTLSAQPNAAGASPARTGDNLDHRPLPASGPTDQVEVQRQDAPSASAAAAAGAAPAAPEALIVEDGEQNPRPGQLRKSEFIARARSAINTTIDQTLSGSPYANAARPHVQEQIEWDFTTYGAQGPAELERFLRQQLPDAAGATTITGLIEPICDHVRDEIVQGLANNVPGPDATAGAAGAGGAADAASSPEPSTASPLLKARSEGARDYPGPLDVKAQLSSGHDLDSRVQAGAEAAFGQSLAGVRVHSDAGAAQLADRLNARAVTVGSDIAFGAGEYQPGNPIGDALIAHELAHVAQQRGADSSPTAQLKGDPDDSALESDADNAAVAAVLTLWGRAQGAVSAIGREAPARLKSGLRLSRCAKQPQPGGTQYDEGSNRFGGSPSKMLRDAIPNLNRDESASHDEILQHLATLNAGGTYVFFGHSASDATGTVVGVNPASGHTVTGKQMQDALAKDSNPPTLVVLGACGTEALLDNILKGGVPVAMGTSANAANVALASAVGTFMQQLTKNSTFAKAKEAADEQLQKLSPGAEIVVRFADGYDSSMTLADAKAKHLSGP